MFRSETMKEGLTMLGEEFGGAKNPREGRQCELRREKERIRVSSYLFLGVRGYFLYVMG